MRKHLLGLMLIAGLAGCTSESDSDLTDVASNKAVDAPDGGTVPTGASLAAQRGSAASFASLPDRGELMAYGGVRKSRQSGAYTYHPVAISEAHALNAIGRGELVVATPDGEPVRIKYERHEEQPDGNWTWIGRNADGTSAVLTFGEKAVFGMISRGDEYYRVRTDRTGAWVVQTERSLLVSGGGRREKGPDALLPPDARALSSAAAHQLARSDASSSNKTASAAVSTKAAVGIVDVLVGYSSGLTSLYGSQSAAATAMSSLVALTNDAYTRSGVSMRVRLVHALQVNYADTSDNKDALHQLTGYNSDTGQPITPNSAFNALRAARNEYGADLVAFVRRYREPEQDGCGIAWLLGMNGSDITVSGDADFGYAVVGDGEDRDEGDGNTYFCSDYSLAHEFGHLMGQAHNTEDAPDAGAHSYSYGYRESSATGFHTIMAYPLGGAQIEAPFFANPAVRYRDRATGTNTRNNARSMNETMPILANFRATVVPVTGLRVRNDLNGDGKSDLLWFKPVAGDSLRYWRMDGARRTGTVAGNLPAGGYQFVATGDFNGDRKVDILWRKSPGNSLVMWTGNGTTFTEQAVESYSSVWDIAGVADIDGDGKSDLVWKHASAADNVRIWLMNGKTRRLVYGARTSVRHSLDAVGDFNGDGKVDLFWRYGSDAAIWYSKDKSFDVSPIQGYSSAWRAIAAGDLDGDGREDLVWWQPGATSSNMRYWAMTVAGRKVTSGTSPSGATFAASGDYNADGRLDLVWRNGKSLTMWLRGTSSYSSRTLPDGYSSPWEVMK